MINYSVIFITLFTIGYWWWKLQLTQYCDWAKEAVLLKKKWVKSWMVQGWYKFPLFRLTNACLGGHQSCGKPQTVRGHLRNTQIFTSSMKYLVNQNTFSLFYSKRQLLLSRLWVEYFSNQEKVRDDMWNFSSQDKHPFMKPKYFVVLADLLSFLGGLLRDGGNGEFNQPGISDLRFCRCFFCIKQLPFRDFSANYSIFT